MELKHLMGDACFRSIRQHCLAIPWKEADVRCLLNRLQLEEISPYKLQQIWQTLNWEVICAVEEGATLGGPPGASGPAAPQAAALHGPELLPIDRKDLARAEQRAGHDLPKGRPVLGVTQKPRDKLLEGFDAWLKEEGLSLSSTLYVGEPDIEALNVLLGKFGRQFKAGH